MIIYDCEIKKMILGRNERLDPSLQYCAGWSDYEGMGISVICLYNTVAEKMYTLTPQDDPEHADTLRYIISKADYMVGFNNHGFDNKLLQACGFPVPVEKSYNIYEQVIIAAGLADAPFYERKGYRLDDLARANSLPRKNDDSGGALAPALYQRGEIERLHRYCQNDVQMTVAVINRILDHTLLCPRHNEVLEVHVPSKVLGEVQVGLF